MDLTTILTLAQYLALLVGSIVISKALATIFLQLRIMATRLNAAWAQQYGKDSWAVVTGCTEGIGKAFCFQLAQLGFSLVLVSRNSSKLEALNKQLWARFPSLNVVIVQADFAESNEQLYRKIGDKILHLDISMLVNNVGLSHMNELHLQSRKQIDQQIKVNVEAMTYMTQLVLASMLERNSKSAIINLSSLSVTIPMKYLSVYTATKGYNDLFSRILSQEYSGKIDVISCRAGLVSTAATRNTQDMAACSAQDCARGTLKALGKVQRTEGHYSHTFQFWTSTLLGETLTRMFGSSKVEAMKALTKQA